MGRRSSLQSGWGVFAPVRLPDEETAEKDRSNRKSVHLNQAQLTPRGGEEEGKEKIEMDPAKPKNMKQKSNGSPTLNRAFDNQTTPVKTQLQEPLQVLSIPLSGSSYADLT